MYQPLSLMTISLMTKVKRYLLLSMAILLFMGQTIEAGEQQCSCGTDKCLVLIVGVSLMVGCFVILKEGSGRYPNNFPAIKNRFLQMPTIKYIITSPDSGGQTPLSIKLTPSVEYSSIITRNGSGQSLKDWKARLICDPVTKVSSIDQYQNRIYTLCLKRLDAPGFVLPHELSSTELEQSNKIVLPELVYNIPTNTLSFIVSAVPFNGKQSKLIKSYAQKKWISPGIDGARLNEDFKICHFTRGLAGMNPPKIHSNGLPYFEFVLGGVSRLHNNDKSYFVVVTQGASSLEGFYWVSGMEWPEKAHTMELR